jgi:hypothetical protein
MQIHFPGLGTRGFQSLENMGDTENGAIAPFSVTAKVVGESFPVVGNQVDSPRRGMLRL